LNLTPDQQDRAQGVLLGAAVGDALGVPYEFAAPLGRNEVPVMKGGGLGPYEPGEYSDDTQMAVMIAEAVLSTDLRTADGLDAVALGFLRWRREGATDIGAQTGQVLASAKRGLGRGRSAGDVMARAAAALHARTGRSAGNGSLMRTAPVALRYLGDAGACADAARKVSALTHHDPLAGDACVIWCEAIRRAVLGDQVSLGITSGLALVPEGRRDEWEELLSQAEAGPPQAFSPNGYVATALQAAYAAVCASRGQFAEGVYSAVRAGSDTDTVAAIAGALLGALLGADAIPPKWAAEVHGWPGQDGESLKSLALRLAELGQA
jgi:ADP-ribosylglycohydrolase